MCIIEKIAKVSKPPKPPSTKSFCARTMKLGQHLCQIHANAQKKLQVAAIFRYNAI
jgi:hypothetical protein